MIVINFVCPVLLVSVLCDICVLSCRLNTFRRVLDAEMKDLTADGVALKTKRAEKVGISAEEEKMFWDKGLLGCQTAEILVNTIYFYNGKLFGIRAKEHRDLMPTLKLLIQIVLYLMKVIRKHFMVV